MSACDAMDDATAKLHFATLLGMPPQLMYPFMFPPPAGCTFFSTPTCSPSSSPPGSPGLTGSPPRAKSFTIEAILGLRQPTTFVSGEMGAGSFTDGRTPLSPAGLSSALPASDHVTCRNDKLAMSGGRIGRPKRVRTIFTTEQLDSMEKAFAVQQYMVGKQRCHLANTLNLHENQVKVWFQNRRIKWRRQSLEREQARLSQLSQPADVLPAATET